MATHEKFDRTNGHVDRETGSDALHREYFGMFHVGPHREEIFFAYRCPVRIHDAINSADRDKIAELVSDLYFKMMVNAVRLNIQNGAQIVHEECIRTYVDNLYRTFVLIMKRQGTATGKLAWLVPNSMQEVGMEEN
jgi:hypothetical protein